ncbi:MAG: glutamate synthase [Candidatus Eisenbacteria bacterium]
MSVLRPLPASLLLRRALLQREREGAVFDLPERKVYRGIPDLDCSVRSHGERASTPLGPAAGPHTQLAQNVVLADLAGGRIHELKTVQVLDRLRIPRPCIDMATVGFNVEWSQELSLQESAHEYVKARVLLAALREAGVPEGLPPRERDSLFDISVGYDLAGVRSAKVARFLETMRDASRAIEAVRGEMRAGLPARWKRLADVPVPPRVGSCATISTFHGCPPGEIESIALHLMDAHRFHVVVKMNPTLLGFDEVAAILRGELGYDELRPPRDAFESDLCFSEGVDLLRSLRAAAERLGRSVGAKFTNTLVVENHKAFFRDERMYLSGPPLHVVALELSARFREEIGADLPISFSAGVDARNYPDAVAAGLVPVTVCTDLLQPGGYGRFAAYHESLGRRMREAGARTVDEFILRTDDPAGEADEKDGRAVREASLRNHRRAADRARRDPRYTAEVNRTPPRKLGSRLSLFDCVNCDKCVPVCPNNANFIYEVNPRVFRCRDVVVRGGTLVFSSEAKEFAGGTGKRPWHQIANLPDLCNDCGNCDVFCPEEGGPQALKPRVFLSRDSFLEDRGPGFFFERRGSGLVMAGRWEGAEVELRLEEGLAVFSDGKAELVFAGDDAEPSEMRLIGEAREGHAVPVGLYLAMRVLAEGLLSPEASSYPAVSIRSED